LYILFNDVVAQVASPDIVVPTLDTVRHESLLYTWLAEHKPMGQ
jgi:hypothetical protein